ncbi:MAG: hypothetical protein E7256_02810 [Lachnospiraceae bacterium]|nr:hypothetical protein [Lachnospiraceae bacterium]
MENLSAYLSKKLCLSLGYDKQKEQVLTYGLIAILQFVTIMLLAMIIGFFGNFMLESIVIFLLVGVLRKSTGGAHASTMNGCITMSCLNITLLAFLSRYVLIFSIEPWIYLCFYILCYIVCFLIINRYAPVDSPNKRITSQEKITRLRKQSYIKAALFMAASILLTFYSKQNIRCQSVANSLCLLTLWQCFTLTPSGGRLIHHLDRLFPKK